MKRSKSLKTKKLKNLFATSILVLATLMVTFFISGSVLAANKDSVVMGMWSSPGNSFLPHFYQLGYARAVYKIVFNSLIVWDDDGKIVPKMAESYKISPDGKTYRFKIRSNAVWHDGKPVTAQDVAFTIECLTDPDYSFMDFNLVSGISGAKDRKTGKTKKLSGIKIVDEKTIEIKSDGIFAPLLDGFTELQILPYHILKGIPVKELVNSSFASNPTVGNGPYKFVKYATDQYVEFTRFDKYYLGKPNIKKVYLRIVSPDTAIAQLGRGELDLIIGQGLANIPNIEISRIKRVSNLDIQVASGQSSQGLMLICNQEKLKDLRIRKAFAHAINRPGIVKQILLGGGTVTAIARANGYPFYNKNLKAHAYDPDLARKLLKEAGWNKDTVLRLAVPTGNKERIQWATVSQQNLTEVGIKVELQQMDIATMIKTVRKTPEKIDGFFVGYKNYMDPYMYFHRRFHTESLGGGNLLHYSNPALDKLITASALTVDFKERSRLFNHIQEILYKELPVIPILCPTSTIAVNKRIKGPKNSILPISRNIHEWVIK